MLRRVILISLLFSSYAHAHDYWIRPIDFFPKVGQALQAHLLVGDHFNSESERPYQPKMTLKYELVGATETIDLRKESKKDQKPIFRRKLKKAGTYWIAIERDFAKITLEAKKFNIYLQHEGLGHILKKREKAGEALNAARERYSRHLKSLIQVGDKSDDTWKKRVGHRLEIIPLKNPLTQKKGDVLPFQILFEKKPLSKVAVFVYRKSNGKVTEQSLRTDGKGMAKCRITGPGVWLIRLVHMKRCANPKLADWESHWSALSFGTR